MNDEPRAPKKAALKRQAVIGCWQDRKTISRERNPRTHFRSLPHIVPWWESPGNHTEAFRLNRRKHNWVKSRISLTSLFFCVSLILSSSKPPFRFFLNHVTYSAALYRAYRENSNRKTDVAPARTGNTPRGNETRSFFWQVPQMWRQ